MKKGFKKWLTGLSVPQEYVCMAFDESDPPFDLHVTSGDREFKVDDYVLLGYSPVLIAIVQNPNESPWQDDVSLLFKDKSNQRTVAELRLKKDIEREEGDNRVCFFRATAGRHQLISSFNQKINSWWMRWKHTPNGFIQLQGSLYEQVRIAYAIPRKISLISLGDRNAMNMFPTDLHGTLGTRYYTSSLRIGGKACLQVEQQGRLLICDMLLSAYRDVYAMGKNHMREMRDVSAFATRTECSKQFGIPVPQGALRYRELEIADSFDRGVHRVFVYRRVNEVELDSAPCLSHIHNYALQWRLNQGYHTNYQLR